MTQEAKQFEVPNFEATSDGKNYLLINNSSKYSGKIQQERKYIMDITELLRGAEMTRALMGRKRNWNTRRFHMEQQHRSIVPDDKIGVQHTVRQNSCKRFYPTIQWLFLTKKKHLSQSRGILLDKTDGSRNIGRLLAKTHRNCERMLIRRNNSRKPPHFKIHDRNHGYRN